MASYPIHDGLLDSGVPQRSVLGPILFCLYVAELENIFSSHGISAIIYADDTQIYIIIDKQQHDDGTVDLEPCLKDFMSWCVSNKLVLNDGKTQILHIHSTFSRSFSPKPEIVIGLSSLNVRPVTWEW